MKAVIAGALLALVTCGSAAAQGSHYVRGYTKSNGTYVAPHYQSNPNSTTSDNYSTRGNVNPYTGQAGTRTDTRPSYSYSPPPQPTYTAPAYTNPYAPKPPKTCYGYGC